MHFIEFYLWSKNIQSISSHLLIEFWGKLRMFSNNSIETQVLKAPTKTKKIDTFFLVVVFITGIFVEFFCFQHAFTMQTEIHKMLCELVKCTRICSLWKRIQTYLNLKNSFRQTKFPYTDWYPWNKNGFPVIQSERFKIWPLNIPKMLKIQLLNFNQKWIPSHRAPDTFLVGTIWFVINHHSIFIWPYILFHLLLNRLMARKQCF